MTPGRPTGTTPFALVYEMDVVIPIKIGMPTARTTIQGQRDEKQELERQLDWVDEVRGNTTIRMASYQQRVISHCNKKTQAHTFRVGTLVLRRVFENTVKRGVGKGPVLYLRLEIQGLTTYKH